MLVDLALAYFSNTDSHYFLCWEQWYFFRFEIFRSPTPPERMCTYSFLFYISGGTLYPVFFRVTQIKPILPIHSRSYWHQLYSFILLNFPPASDMWPSGMGVVMCATLEQRAFCSSLLHLSEVM